MNDSNLEAFKKDLAQANAREESAEYPIENSLWLIGETFSDLEDLCFAVQSACRITDSDVVTLTFKDARRLA